MKELVTLPKEDWDDLKREVRELKDSVDSLLLLWQQAQAIVVFVKYSAAIAGGLWAFYMAMRSIFQIKG